MSNLQLPTSGSLNWGPSLNGYLERLSNRVSTLENSIQDVDGSIIRNIGYASSGVVGDLIKNEMDSSGNLTIQGNFFIGGDVNTYYANPTITTGDGVSFSSLDSNNSLFVYLSFDSEEETFTVQTTSVYEDHYKNILIGLFRSQGSTPKYIPLNYSSAKTLSQHAYDRKTRYIDIDSYGVYFNFIIGSTGVLSVNLQKGGSNVSTEDLIATFYLDGINTSNGTNQIPYGLRNLDKKDIQWAGHHLLYKDSISNGVRTYSSVTEIKGESGKSTICRVLINVFGDIVIQQCANTDIQLVDGNYSYNEQALYNATFVTNFTKTDDSNNTLSLEATHMIEICRFGFMDAQPFSFSQNGGTTTEGVICAFVSSMDKGLAYTNFNNNWPVLNSKINVDNVKFVKSGEEAQNGFNLKFNNTNAGIKDINLNYDLYNGTGTPNLLFDKTNIIDSGIKLQGKNGVLELGDKVNLTLGENSGIRITNSGILIQTDFDEATKPYLWLSNSIAHLGFDEQFLGMDSDSCVLYNPSITIGADGENVTSSNIYLKGTTNITGETTINGDLTIADGYQILFSSDKRRKTNFETIPESYLHVVNSVPVVGYTYKGSMRQQVGIMAQDLEAVLQDHQDAFIDIQDTSELKNRRSLYETKLTYILWKALQEETQARKELEKRLEALENK